MAVNIGPKIGIDGEAEYRRAIQGIIQETKTLKSEMQATASAWDKDTSAQKKNAEQRKILGKQVQAQKDKVAELQNMLEKSEAKYGENAQQTLKWKQAVNEATAELNKLEQELKNIPNGLQEMGKGLQETGDRLKGIGDAIMPISAAAAAGLGAAVKLTADFDQQMSKVGAISGATAAEMETLRDKAREMGAETKFSASEAGEAMEYMAMAGWKAADMVGGIEGIMNLAAASGESLATTSDIVTDALTAFGLSAEDSGHFADVLAAASSNANTNVAMMGETFKYAAPIAGALGFSIEDTALAIGLMANSGIKASQAGTALRTIFNNLTEDVVITGDALGKVVISTTNADGSMRDLSSILMDMRGAFSQLSESEKAANAETIAGKNAMSGLLAIMNAAPGDVDKLGGAIRTATYDATEMAKAVEQNGVAWGKYADTLGGDVEGLVNDIIFNLEDLGKTAEETQEYLQMEYNLDADDAIKAIRTVQKEMKNSTGTAKKMADAMQDNLNGQLTILKSGLEEAAISIGDALMPQIRNLTKGVQDGVTWFNSLDDSTKNLVARILVLTAAAGPLLKVSGQVVSTVGKGVEAFGSFAATVQNAGGVTAYMSTILSGTAVQAGLVLAPLTAMAVGFTEINKSITGVSPELQAFRDEIAQTSLEADATSEAITSLGDSINRNGEAIEGTGAPLEKYRDQLNKCFDSQGNLKEGMEETASYVLNQLNEAMGTDYSLEFIQHANDSKQALEEINAAIDQTIVKMKEQSIQTAFNADYSTALKNQADATVNLATKQDEYNRALEGAKQAQLEVNAALARDPRTDPGAVRAQTEAVRAANEYRTTLQQTSDSLVQAEGDAARANAQLDGLNKTMDALAKGTPEGVEEATQAYASLGAASEEAGKKAEEAARSQLQTWDEVAQEIESTVIQPPQVDQAAAKQNADTTTATMQGEFDANKFTGYVDKVDGGEQAAMNAAGYMTKIVSVPMQGKVDRVDGADTAARNAWNTMKSFFVNNPITVAIKGVVTSGTGNRYSERAEGGFIRQQQVALIGEDGPEVIIPLSAGKRARAMDLFSQTAAILGVGADARAYLPAAGVASNNTMNMGGVNINVYGAEGQDVHELAREVADLVQSQVESKGAVWS